SCQTAPLAPPLSSETIPTPFTPAQNAKQKPIAEQHSARATLHIQPNAQGQPQLTLEAYYPPQSLGFSTSARPGFELQALNYGQFARFQVSIQGIGLNPALYPATADANQNHTIAAANCSLAAGCHLNTA